MTVLQPLEQRTTSDVATSALRDAILAGAFAPGEQLRETKLSTQLGISRASLREALARLTDEGLVVKISFRGAYVAEVEPRVIDEIALLRKRLEPEAIGLSLQLHGELFLKELRRRVEALAKVADRGDQPAAIAAHLAVHGYMYEMSGHTLMARMWKEWEVQLRLFLSIDHRSFSDLHDIGEEHRTLLQVIETQDRAAIEAIVQSHVHGSAPLRD